MVLVLFLNFKLIACYIDASLALYGNIIIQIPRIELILAKIYHNLEKQYIKFLPLNYSLHKVCETHLFIKYLFPKQNATVYKIYHP